VSTGESLKDLLRGVWGVRLKNMQIKKEEEGMEGGGGKKRSSEGGGAKTERKRELLCGGGQQGDSKPDLRGGAAARLSKAEVFAKARRRILWGIT